MRGSEISIILVLSIALPLLLIFLLGYLYVKLKTCEKAFWLVNRSELHFDSPPRVIGQGSLGIVVLAQYRGTNVAVKQALTRHNYSSNGTAGPRFGSIAIASVKATTTTSRHELTPWSGSQTLPLEAESIHGSIELHGKKSKGLVSNITSKTTDMKEVIKEMRLMARLRHPNIATIMGAVKEDSQCPSLIMEYLELGSLYDVLHNETIALDGDLVLPILQEVAQGIRFLHATKPPVIHGDLKARNILIDAQFRAKVADFRLPVKQNGAVVVGTPYWMSPELLRGETGNTIASDVFAFGITLCEVYSQKDPYDGEDYATVIRGVIDPTINKRPTVPSSCPSRVQSLMNDCLESDPNSRPIFEEIDLRLQRMSTAHVEPGTSHLSVRAQRELKASRATNLLHNVFLPHIAEALRDGRKVEQESHDCVTIFFSDVVGFTSIASSLSASKVCCMLDRLYAKFDELSRKHEIFKIETVGDAYMAITNLVKDQTTDHVKRCAAFSLDAIRVAGETLIDEDDSSRGYIVIRVGFHSGPVISGVVGTRLPKFGVFGDTVNTSSRMESNSEPGRILCTEVSAKLLQIQAPESHFSIVPRGVVNVKGKGEMTTFWVSGCEDSSEARRNATPVLAVDVLPGQRPSGESKVPQVVQATCYA